jgi:hypothetical protein
MSITPKIITGPEFKKLREATPKISVYALVKSANVSRQQINEFEAGNHGLHTNTYFALLTALETLKTNGNENHR